MSDQQPPVIIIFGITGDLSKRKLLPALYHLFEKQLLPNGTKIIGTSRRELSRSDLLNTIEESIQAKKESCRPEAMNQLNEAVSTAQVDPVKTADFDKLKDLLDTLDSDGPRNRLFYMSIPPSAYGQIISNLQSSGLNAQQNRIMLEKPFGYNFNSAEASVKLVSSAFNEEQIYRIDHYLAKETAQNLLSFRLHNPIFVPLWNNQHIESVHVRQFETLGIEGRVNFYEQTGALRDMIQSHLMQLLALTLMDVPEDMTSRSIHEAKQRFFKGLDIANPALATRGQYQSYRQEVSNPNSIVETYVKLELSSHLQPWQGVKLFLEHGKGMNQNIADIAVAFKSAGERRRNSLIFQIQPNEGISLDLLVKEPGLANEMRHTSLDLKYKDVFTDILKIDAYERVLMDAIRGDQSLFAADEEVLTTWRVLDPLLDAWSGTNDGLVFYPNGASTV
ncbi:MAG TPA: glucose-6-phosphate dehydrogenase [Candidatus Saccharimonadales bacterium]|nr:glucose-6-phosphate dehydrogenase [Candidatus Saccharimonadales bacterium]